MGTFAPSPANLLPDQAMMVAFHLLPLLLLVSAKSFGGDDIGNTEEVKNGDEEEDKYEGKEEPTKYEGKEEPTENEGKEEPTKYEGKEEPTENDGKEEPTKYEGKEEPINLQESESYKPGSDEGKGEKYENGTLSEKYENGTLSEGKQEECLFSEDCRKNKHPHCEVADSGCKCLFGKCVEDGNGGCDPWGVCPDPECDTYKDCDCKSDPKNCFCHDGMCTTEAWECHKAPGEDGAPNEKECGALEKCKEKKCSCLGNTCENNCDKAKDCKVSGHWCSKDSDYKCKCTWGMCDGIKKKEKNEGKEDKYEGKEEEKYEGKEEAKYGGKEDK